MDVIIVIIYLEHPCSVTISFVMLSFANYASIKYSLITMIHQIVWDKSFVQDAVNTLALNKIELLNTIS